MSASQMSHEDLLAVSVRMTKNTLPVATDVYKVAGAVIDHRDTWLLTSQVALLRLLADQLEDVVEEADRTGQYLPNGRPPLRLAGDDFEDFGVGGLRRAA